MNHKVPRVLLIAGVRRKKEEGDQVKGKKATYQLVYCTVYTSLPALVLTLQKAPVCVPYNE